MKQNPKAAKKPTIPGNLAELQRQMLANQLEKDTQEEIINALEKLGYQCLVTNASMHKEIARMAREKGARLGYCSTPGVPDLIVYHNRWPHHVFAGLEVKRPVGGRVRPAQQALASANRIVIVRSAIEAVTAVKAVERALLGGSSCQS